MSIDFSKMSKRDLIQILVSIEHKCIFLDTLADDHEVASDEWQQGYGKGFRQSSKFIKSLLEFKLD